MSDNNPIRGRNVVAYLKGEEVERAEQYMKRHGIKAMNAFINLCVKNELDREEKARKRSKK